MQQQQVVRCDKSRRAFLKQSTLAGLSLMMPFVFQPQKVDAWDWVPLSILIELANLIVKLRDYREDHRKQIDNHIIELHFSRCIVCGACDKVLQDDPATASDALYRCPSELIIIIKQ